MDTPFEMFFCYAPEDEYWRKQIETHLGIFKRKRLISGWHVHKILPGADWASELDKHLKSAHIILLLISPDFINSDECYSEQLQQAIERHKAGTAQVIPILVRPIVSWQDTPFAHLQALPRDGKPLSSAPDKDEALVKVAEGIQLVIEELRQKQQATPPPSAPAIENTQKTIPPEPIEPIWHIPFRRNTFFTGREDVLSQIHTQLQDNKTTALSQPIAMSGLGGIGKTQTAVEYAYRYRGDYHVVCWVKASTPEELAEDFAAIATLLHLQEHQEQEQKRIITAVKRWFETHSRWLLIFDNADELPILYDYLSEDYKGHVLITTRTHATADIATSIEMQTMQNEEGVRLLLQRARIIKQDASLEQVKKADLEAAYAIINELGGLPLALDQAGAYIEETGESLTSYLPLYRQERAALLRRRGGLHPDHAPVATTWELALQNIELDDPAAIELIRLYAFLAPDAIPEDMLNSDTAQFLPNILKPLATKQTRFNEAVALLLKYSLIQRANKTVTIHRLVQAVIKDGMGKTKQVQWAERVVRMLEHTIPFDEAGPWPQSQRYIAHALIAVEYIDKLHFTMYEAWRLLHTLGVYFHNRSQLSEAKPLLQQALSICEKHIGYDRPETSAILTSLALLYHDQGNFDQAEPLYQRSLYIDEQCLGPDHPNTASALHNLGFLYWSLGKLMLIEPLLLRALSIKEKHFGPDHPDTAHTLHNLATLYRDQGKYEVAEALYQRTLFIREQRLGSDHPDTAHTLHNLAIHYRDQGKIELAQPLYQRALAIREQRLGLDHLDTAESLNDLANLYQKQGNFELAEPLFQRALSIREQRLGPDHPETATTLNDLALFYQEQGKFEMAEPLLRRALSIREQRLGADHHKTVESRQRYVELQEKMAK